MTLYELLDISRYYQNIWIYENNVYDQNMPIYKGTVQGAREDSNRTWEHLMDRVDLLDWEAGVLLVYVVNEYKEKRLEKQYTHNHWGKAKSERPWRTSLEIKEELRGEVKT